MDGSLRTDAEATHLLLQLLLSNTFDTTSSEYEGLVKKVIESVKSSAEAAASSGRTSRVEAASRM